VEFLGQCGTAGALTGWVLFLPSRVDVCQGILKPAEAKARRVTRSIAAKKSVREMKYATRGLNAMIPD